MEAQLVSVARVYSFCTGFAAGTASPQPPSLPSQKLLLPVVLRMQNDSLLCLHRLKTSFPNSDPANGLKHSQKKLCTLLQILHYVQYLDTTCLNVIIPH